MSSLFDIFSNDSAEKAAADKTNGLNLGYSQASDLLDQGRGVLNSNYNAALQPFKTLFNQSQAGAGAYGDATGANGAAGYTRANQNFQANPGYQFQFDQGLKALDRGAASRGNVTSGNTLNAEQNYGAGLANQSYQQYVTNLQPYLNQGTSAATGIANVDTGLGNALNTSYGNQGQLAYQTQAGIGNANAAADLNNYNVSNNMFGALMGGLTGATKLAGGF